MEENEAKTVLDRALDIFDKHPTLVTCGFFGLLTVGTLKVCEGSLSRAIYKANTRTVDYILQQFRYLR